MKRTRRFRKVQATRLTELLSGQQTVDEVFVKGLLSGERAPGVEPGAEDLLLKRALVKIAVEDDANRRDYGS